MRNNNNNINNTGILTLWKMMRVLLLWTTITNNNSGGGSKGVVVSAWQPSKSASISQRSIHLRGVVTKRRRLGQINQRPPPLDWGMVDRNECGTSRTLRGNPVDFSFSSSPTILRMTKFSSSGSSGESSRKTSPVPRVWILDTKNNNNDISLHIPTTTTTHDNKNKNGRMAVVDDNTQADDGDLPLTWSEVTFLRCTDETNDKNDDPPNDEEEVVGALEPSSSSFISSSGHNSEWMTSSSSSSSSSVRMTRSMTAAARQTWNWCQHFVVPLKLCPWAKTSLDTPLALQLFMVPEEEEDNDTNDSSSSSTRRLERQRHQRDIVASAAHQFQTLLAQHPTLASSAIFFVVFVVRQKQQQQQSSMTSSPFEGEESDNTTNTWSFPDFYDWFIDLEDGWGETSSLADEVTLAPFHPEWQFFSEGGDDDDEEGDNDEDEDDDDYDDEGVQLSFEKKSPFPTVTLVSTRTIDQAGPSVTDQIAQSNYVTLTQQTVQELQDTWNKSIRRPADASSSSL
jgi:hypothetical protein